MQLYFLETLSNLKETQSELALKQYQQLLMQEETRELLNDLNAYDSNHSKDSYEMLELSFESFVDTLLIAYKQAHEYYHISKSIKQAFEYHKIVNTKCI